MRWSKGGSRAATGNGDAAAAANQPERGAAAGDPSINGLSANEAAQIQALLHSLSQVRLAVSADLSAAAGALEDGRADIAADVIAGARGELAELRAGVRRRESVPSPFPRKVPVTVAGAGAGAEQPVDADTRVSEQAYRRPRHRLASALAGAAALAVAIAVIPQVTRGSSHPSTAAGAQAVQQSPDIRLASSEFTVLSHRLLAADAAPATILAAERSWQGAVSSSLPTASRNAATASSVVTMLRQERTLLFASPALRLPANQALATTLVNSSQNLLTQLRRLADEPVLAILPTVLNALPLPPGSIPTVTKVGAGPTPAPSTGPASGSGTGVGSGTGTGTGIPTQPAPSPGAPDPTALPSAPASNSPLQLPVPTAVPTPVQSTLSQLTGGAGAGDLGQTVGNLLNGLGLGG